MITIGMLSYDHNGNAAERDFESLPEASQLKIVQYGWFRGLNDSTAGKKGAEAEGAFNKRLDSIDAGTWGSRQRGPTDPVERAILKYAIEVFNNKPLAWRKARIAKLLAANPTWEEGEAVSEIIDRFTEVYEVIAEGERRAAASAEVEIDLPE